MTQNIYKFFISSILLICSYNMDINKNYKTYLNNKIIINHLKKSKIDDKIIKYIKKNINLNGKITYLRNEVDTECMIFDSEDSCYLVFIGTQKKMYDKLLDLFSSICLGLKSISFLDPKIKIHSKYIENMKNQNLLDKIITIVNKSKHKNITICGHSLGCGLGLYTSLVLSEKFSNKNFDLITIASPKIGNYYLNKYVKKIKNLKHFDLINSKDIIVLYPFIYPEYYHISNKTYIIKPNGKIDLCKHIEKKIDIFTNYSINDHYIRNIIYNIFMCINKGDKYYIQK